MNRTNSEENPEARIARIKASLADGIGYMGFSPDGEHQGDAADCSFLLGLIDDLKQVEMAAQDADSLLQAHGDLIIAEVGSRFPGWEKDAGAIIADLTDALERASGKDPKASQLQPAFPFPALVDDIAAIIERESGADEFSVFALQYEPPSTDGEPAVFMNDPRVARYARAAHDAGVKSATEKRQARIDELELKLNRLGDLAETLWPDIAGPRERSPLAEQEKGKEI